MSSSSGSSLTWAEFFCKTVGNEFFALVDDEYIADQFNLTGLNDVVPCFKAAWRKIMDDDSDSDSTGSDDIEKSAEMLYGLIHARYILTTNGLRKMLEKAGNKDFGTCPRVYCFDTPVIPTGRHDETGLDTVKVFCPNCEEVYQPKQSRHRTVDGAYFGSSFAQMLLMVHPHLRRKKPPIRFTPRLYGFHIHPSAFFAYHG